jgi:hypothetical protein
MQMNHYSQSTMENVLMSLTINKITQQDLASPEIFKLTEAIIKAGEAASKLIYGENK